MEKEYRIIETTEQYYESRYAPVKYKPFDTEKQKVDYSSRIKEKQVFKVQIRERRNASYIEKKLGIEPRWSEWFTPLFYSNIIGRSSLEEAKRDLEEMKQKESFVANTIIHRV